MLLVLLPGRVWGVSQAHLTRQVLENVVDVPVSLCRRFVEGQVPPAGERLDGRGGHLSFAHEIALGSDDDDGDLQARALGRDEVGGRNRARTDSEPFIRNICFRRLSTSFRLTSCVKLCEDIMRGPAGLHDTCLKTRTNPRPDCGSQG